MTFTCAGPDNDTHPPSDRVKCQHFKQLKPVCYKKILIGRRIISSYLITPTYANEEQYTGSSIQITARLPSTGHKNAKIITLFVIHV